MLLPVLEVLNSKRIILASASVNRKNILEKTGLKFEVSPSTFEENLPHSEFPTTADYVVKTSEMKL
jgi:septum formation protein